MKKITVLSILGLIFTCLAPNYGLLAQGFNSISSSNGTSVIAVGDNGKIYRSVNGGLNWINSTIGSVNLNGVCSVDTSIWIAADNGNIYRKFSTNSITENYSTGGTENLHSVKFINANTGYACGEDGKVFKSVNGGVNWSLSNTGIGSFNLNSIDFRDAVNGITAGDSGVIYYTADGGASWSLSASGTTRNLLKIKYFNDSIAAVGEYGTLILNNGSGWTSADLKTTNDVRGISGQSMNRIRICGGGGFIRNNMNGNFGFLNFEMNPMLANLTDIFYYDLNKAWAVSSLNSVIIYTTNGGTSWSMPGGSSVTFNWVSKLSAGGFLGNNLSLHPTNRNTIFCAFGNQVYVSRNRGENWITVGIPVPAGSTPHSFFVNPVDTNLWMIALESSPDRVYRSTNYGANWTLVLSLNFSNYGQPLEIDQNNPANYYFAPDGGGFYRSTDYGASFTEISGNYPFRSPCEILVTWDSSEIIILGDGVTGSGIAKMFKSTNNGVNWTETGSATSSETPSMCNSEHERNIVWCTEWSGANIYKSTDFGSSFSVHHSTGFSGWGSDVCREDPTMVITGSWGAAATLSTNGGNNWTNISTGLSGHGGGIIIPDRGYILAQQNSNIYKLNIVYTDSPVSENIDVQVLTINQSGVQYFSNSTIELTGTVKNNNGAFPATFTVTRKISPGGYVSSKVVSNLGALSSTTVTFDPWTFISGTAYTITDSAYISGDVNNSNNVLSANITPNLGAVAYKLNEGYSGAFPPVNWALDPVSGNKWIYNSASSYGLGVGCAEYNFWGTASGTIHSLITDSFTPSVAGDSLDFDRAYSPYANATRTDSLIIESSTNGGSTYSVLFRMYGNRNAVIGGNNVLNTTSSSAAQYFPSANHWLNKKIGLPVGTNKIKFRARSANGNNLFIDSVKISGINLYTQYNIKVTPEGLFNGISKVISDTIKVYLRNISSPFAVVDSTVSVINSQTLIASCSFQNVQTGTYYIQVRHRNALETWSKTGGESITKGVTANYDFTSLQSQSYGNNSVLKLGSYCLYSGDVNQDGSIDGSDMSQIDNDASNFSTGYLPTDLNGDENIDGSDLAIADNNSANFVTKNTPETMVSDRQSVTERSKFRNSEYRKNHLQVNQSTKK